MYRTYEQELKLKIYCIVVDSLYINLFIIHFLNREVCTANFEQNSKNLSTLQGRFKNLLSEKGAKEAELKKAYSEIEDSFSKFDTFGNQ